MKPETTAPSPAGDRPVSPLARRIGLAVAATSVTLTVLLLVWLALAPTAVVGPLTDAPFEVPATLVLPPDDEGCLGLVEGDGSSRTHCIDRLAREATDEHEYRYVEVWFDAEGRLVVVDETGSDRTVLEVDPATGEVLGELGDEMPPERRFEEDGEPEGEVVVDGDVVRRMPETPEADPEDGAVLLDLDGPPGYRLHDAVLSPDGAWVVVVTPGDEVVVAPVDGSSAPRAWATVPEDGWLDLRRGVYWRD